MSTNKDKCEVTFSGIVANVHASVTLVKTTHRHLLLLLLLFYNNFTQTLWVNWLICAWNLQISLSFSLLQSLASRAVCWGIARFASFYVCLCSCVLETGSVPGELLRFQGLLENVRHDKCTDSMQPRVTHSGLMDSCTRQKSQHGLGFTFSLEVKWKKIIPGILTRLLRVDLVEMTFYPTLPEILTHII